MKAAVCREFGQPLAIEEIDLLPAGPGEVTVDIKACAICHSDIFFIDGAWGGSLPAVYGHEAAGVVRSVGAGVTAVKPGQPVVVTLIRSCGHCISCMEGIPVACEGDVPLDSAPVLTSKAGERVVQGMETGAFAEAVTVHESQVVGMPGDMSFDAASLLACGVITGFGAVVNTARVEPGSTVAVIGAGGVGLNTVQGAVIAGARTIIALDISDSKLETALRFGATHAVQAAGGEAVEKVRALTDGRGADYVFVTVGAKPAFQQAFPMAARAGAVVLVGMPPTGVMAEIDPGTVAAANQRILGSKMGTSRIGVDIPNLISLYRQGRLKLDELITNRYPLDGINEALASTKRGEALRNVILF
ncbi:Zn-dependent alcohol dehydrogenase [Hwanghaeella sp.]|uniref:Zn-dependent alcohol dehydrogenase n=1 Tax=Hwanghaeella sp. TaxID=2605943 RepID=UPI003CCB86D9